MNIVILILGIVLVILGVALKIVDSATDNEKRRVWISLVGVAVIIISQSFTIIPTGFTGVRSTFGQIDKNVVSNGFNIKIPFVQSIEQVNNKQQDIVFKDSKVWSETSSRTAIYYDNITVTYQISADKSSWIFSNISDYKSNLITTSLVSSGIKSASKGLEDTKATNRSIIEPLAQEYIQKSVDDKYGSGVLTINKVVINNADFDEDYNQAIADKQKAQLAKEQQDIVNEQNIAKAEAEKEALKIKADGEAEAAKIKADGEAAANEKIEKSLTDNILRDKYLEKWNGELPQVVSDGDGLIFDISEKGK